MVQGFVDVIVAFVREHQNWAAPMAFLVAFGESICFLSLIWPGTAILAGITGLLAASGSDMSILMPSILAAGLGGTVGYSLSYYIGLYFKDSVGSIWPFSRRPQLIPQGKQFFERYGAWGVFLGHFFGPVRAVIPVVAGMFAMRQLPFQVANISSAFIWAAGVIAPTFFAVTFKDELFSLMRDFEPLVAVILFGLAVLNAIPTPMMAIPTLVLFVALGAAHLFAGGNVEPLVVSGAIGAIAGDYYGYVTGRKRPDDFETIWPNSWSPEAADRARAAVASNGVMALLWSKFSTTLRAFVPLAAGAAGKPVTAFLGVSAISALVWVAVLLLPRYAIGWLMTL